MTPDPDCIRANLADLAAMWVTLSAEPGRGASERISGTPEKSLGVRVAILDLMLPAGSQQTITDSSGDQIGSVPVGTVLDSWARIIADDRNEWLPGVTVPKLAEWLSHRADWACRHLDGVNALAHEVHACLMAVKRAAGQIHEDQMITIGACPTQDSDGTECGQTLRVEQHLDVVTCPRCSKDWRKKYWLWIHDRQKGGNQSTELDVYPVAC